MENDVKETLEEVREVLACVCPECESIGAWKILKDGNDILGQCQCGFITIVGVMYLQEELN